MNRKPIAALTLAALIAGLGAGLIARGQGVNVAPRYEVAIVRWDGPDRIQLLTPQKSESIGLLQAGVQMPKDMSKEEFCLTWAANKMAQDGWEPVNLDSTRILLRRSVIR